MKKLIILLGLILTISSCTESNIKEVTSKDQIPIEVFQASKDTTVKYDLSIYKSENNTYIIKNHQIIQRVCNEDKYGVLLFVGCIGGILFSLILYSIFNDN